MSALYVRYAGQIGAYIASRLHGHDPELVDDLVQIVFLEVVARIHAYEDRGWPFSAWLYSIARSRLIDHARAERRRAHFVTIEDCALATDCGIGAAFDRADAAPLLAALATLTPVQRQVLTLRFLQDVTLMDVAARLGVTVGSVKAAQYRGLAALEKRLTPGADERRRAVDSRPYLPKPRPSLD